MERSTRAAIGLVVLLGVIGISIGGASATDVPLPGVSLVLRDGALLKIVARPPTGTQFPVPDIGGSADPTLHPASLSVFDSGGGLLSDPLSAGSWVGLGTPPGAFGYRYANPAASAGMAPVKRIVLKPSLVKVIAIDDGTLDGPVTGSVGLVLTLGADRYCADFGGTDVRNQAGVVVRRSAPPPAACPAPCCGGGAFVSVESADAPDDCGDVLYATGTLVTNIACGGLYFGGGGNSIPLPIAMPGRSVSVSSITSCTDDTATLGPASSSETGTNRSCTAKDCLFGAPVAVPNPISTPTSYCVVNALTTNATGTLECLTGATSIDVPLSATLYLTGDTSPTPGIQPCPLCTGGSCAGGPNDSLPCVAGTAAIGPGYPTSHDCPPWATNDVGILPLTFALTTGSLTWSATVATNDSGSTASYQNRVFSGYCRDAALPGGTGSFDADAMAGYQLKQCWENGIAVGTPCSEADNHAESCEQRTAGAFGPNGGANRTIKVIGNAMSVLAGPAAATLVSIFSIPPTFDSWVDGSFDLPGPGAVAIPGTVRTCAAANPCP